MNPLGGLPRRKKVLEQVGGKPLVIDAGNALFRATGLDDEDSKKRAKFIFETMAALGTQAMAVGERDLGAGLPFLLELAKGSKVKLLSANLREKGKAPFDASMVVASGKLKVGVIGASPASKGIPPLVAVGDEVKKLKGKVDVLIVLAAMPYPDALQLSTELKTQVDFIVQSGDSRQTPAQLSEGNVVIGAGERGRGVGRLEVTSAGGKGPWVNLDQAKIDQQLLEGLESRIKELKERRKGITDKKALADFDATLKDFDGRRAELAAKANAGSAKGARAFKLQWVALDATVGDDEALKAKVLLFEPTYAAPH
ncbi:MAG: 5'-nucleotidase [Myxococcaceae bacterium]|nr:5'-nucleotidase [Myxococcaceae bacterium]